MCSSGTGKSFLGGGLLGKGGKARCFALLTLPSKIVVGSRSKSSIGYFGFGKLRNRAASASAAASLREGSPDRLRSNAEFDGPPEVPMPRGEAA